MIKKVDLQGVDALKRQIGGMIARGRHPEPLFREIAAILADEVEGNFAAEGRPPWKPSKRAQKEGGKTLQDTGQLAASIQQFVTGSSAGVATNKEYAAIHHFGGEIKRWPFSSTVRLRLDAKGGLLRQKGHGNLAVFARGGHKRATERRFTSEGWTIKMPQREFMKASPGGLSAIETAAAKFITGG